MASFREKAAARGLNTSDIDFLINHDFDTEESISAITDEDITELGLEFGSLGLEDWREHLKGSQSIVVEGTEATGSSHSETDVNKQDSKRHTELYDLCYKGKWTAARRLVKDGATGFDEALIGAADGNHMYTFNWLLTLEPDVNKQDSRGNTALYYLCYNGKLRYAIRIVEAGATGIDEALIGAAKGDHVDIIEWLLTHGADINRENKDGYTALGLACQQGHLKTAQYLVQSGAGLDSGDVTPLMAASMKGHLGVLTWLIEKGAKINKQQTTDGETALRWSCFTGHMEAAKVLLQAGADVNLGDWTPLMGAAYGGHSDVIEWLIGEGADIHKQQTTNGATALYWACFNGHLKAAEVLLQAEANVHLIDWTPFKRAAQDNHSEVIKWLIGKGEMVPEPQVDQTLLALYRRLPGRNMSITEIRPELECFSNDMPGQLFNYSERTAEQVTEWLTALGIKGTGAGYKIVFILHGFRNNRHAQWMREMKNTILNYETSGRVKVVLVDWARAADLYVWQYNTSVLSLPDVSEWISQIRGELLEGFPEIYLHGIGHSLGAHGMGMAGRRGGGVFDRITGLDPAGPHYEEDDQKYFRLSATDAAQVDVIHTDGYSSFGTLMPLGKVDFYVNYGVAPQPGCSHSRICSCSHSRAYKLFTWSVTHPEEFNTKQLMDGNPGPEEVVKKTKPSDREGRMGYHLKSPEEYCNFNVETNWTPEQ